MNQLAYYDQLTQLPNYITFKSSVIQRIQNIQQNGFILLFNLRSLSSINTMLGQDIGDQALVEAFNILSHLNKGQVTLARISGNEFAIWRDRISEPEFIETLQLTAKELEQQSIILNKKLEFYAVYSYCPVSDTYNSAYQVYETGYYPVVLSV